MARLGLFKSFPLAIADAPSHIRPSAGSAFVTPLRVQAGEEFRHVRSVQSMLRLKHDGHKFWPLPRRRLRMLPVIRHYQVQKLAAFLANWSKNSAKLLPQIGTWVEERGSTFRPKGVLSFACSHLRPSKEGVQCHD